MLIADTYLTPATKYVRLSAAERWQDLPKGNRSLLTRSAIRVPGTGCIPLPVSISIYLRIEY